MVHHRVEAPTKAFAGMLESARYTREELVKEVARVEWWRFHCPGLPGWPSAYCLGAGGCACGEFSCNLRG